MITKEDLQQMKAFSERMEIDPSDLVEDWQGQVTLIWEAGHFSATCRRDLDVLREQLKLYEAELQTRIREAPEDYGVEKVTDKAVSSVVESDERRNGMVQSITEADYAYGLSLAAVKAVEHRKAALENICRITMSEYYGTPRASSEGAKEVENQSRTQAHNRAVRSATQTRRPARGKE
jgi:DNA-binding ferritin-like protein (Dps family)